MLLLVLNSLVTFVRIIYKIIIYKIGLDFTRSIQRRFMRVRKLNDTMTNKTVFAIRWAGLSRYSNIQITTEVVETRVAHSNSARNEDDLLQETWAMRYSRPSVDHHPGCGNFRARILGARDNELIMLAIYHKLKLARSPWPTSIRAGRDNYAYAKFQIAILR